MRQARLTRVTGIVGVTIVVVVATSAFLRIELRQGEFSRQEGARLFREKGCSQCHYRDRTETRTGPGLKGILERATLPASGRPATRPNVLRQLEEPYDDMPDYGDRLTGAEKQALLDYLETL